MENDNRTSLDSYGVKSPEEKERDLALENELWEKVLSDMEDEETHKQYVGHVIRNGLLSESSRRYGKVVDDKEKYSINARRLSRFYQKQIVNLLFMKPSVEKTKRKNPTLGYMGVFVSTMVILCGLLSFEFWYLILAGAAYLVPYIYLKFKQSKKLSEKSNSTPSGLPRN